MSKAAFVMSIVALSISSIVMAISIADFLLKFKKGSYMESSY